MVPHLPTPSPLGLPGSFPQHNTGTPLPSQKAKLVPWDMEQADLEPGSSLPLAGVILAGLA